MFFDKVKRKALLQAKKWPARVAFFQKAHPFLSRLMLPVLRLLSLAWFLIRVIPKPSRAAYPCMRVAAPLASGFVLWIGGLTLSSFAFIGMRKYFRQSRYVMAGLLVLLLLVGGGLLITAPQDNGVAGISANVPDPFGVNNPVGEARGIFPGRVVWVHNPDATNENAAWEDLPSRTNTDVWYDDKNNNQDVIDQMFSDGILALTGQSDDASAWDAIFRHFNQSKGKGEVAYQNGEIIFIKINSTSTWGSNISGTMADVKNKYYGISETSPHLMLTVLRHLVNQVGVPQDKIYIGDPMKHIYKHIFDKLHGEFPDVHYLDNNSTYGGREKVQKTADDKIVYSDNGEVIQSSTWSGNPYQAIPSDGVYTIFEDADYVLNIPTMKGHKHAGITMFAKNNFGSHTRGDASHLHPGLIDPTATHPALTTREEYGMYRVLVDLMGHELLGGKMLFYIMDALWSSDYEVDQPDKFQMYPFNNDWTSSLMFSFDPVAIESVGYDILKSEFHPGRYPNESGNNNSGITFYPQMGAVDDYLHQAADPANWPDGVQYDPEGDGTFLGSLGVHEHWNNEYDMQYSRNLGTGEGIELIYQLQSTKVEDEISTGIHGFQLHANYPNPFNPSTTIAYELSEPVHVTLTLFNTGGQKIRTLVTAYQNQGAYEVRWDGRTENGMMAASGIYLYQLKVSDAKGQTNLSSRQMLLMK